MVSPGLAELAVELLVEVAAVGQAGQGVGGGHLLELLHRLFELDVLVLKFFEHPLQADFQAVVFLFDLVKGDVFLDQRRDGQEVIAMFADVVLCAQFDRAGGRAGVVLAGDDEHGDAGTGEDLGQQVQAVDVRQVQVEQDDVEILDGLLEGLGSGRGAAEL